MITRQPGAAGAHRYCQGSRDALIARFSCKRIGVSFVVGVCSIVVDRPAPSEHAVADAYASDAAEVFRIVRAIVGNPASAEEITQDAFLKAFENIERYDIRRPIRPWLITIAVRLALDSTRRERRRSLLTRTMRTGGATASETVAIDARLDIDGILRKLPPKERAVVVARHFAGMSYEEIAEMLSVSPGTVGSLLHRAHGRLRPLLASSEALEYDNGPSVGQARGAK